MSLYRIIGPPLLKLYFDDPRKSLKNTYLFVYMNFKLIPACTPKLLHCSSCTLRNMQKRKKKLLEFSSMGPNNLTLGLPYAWKTLWLDPPLSIGGLYIEPLGCNEGGEFWRPRKLQFTIASLVYAWVCIPLCLWITHCCSSQDLHCLVRFPLRWRIEVVEDQVQDLVSPFRRGADRVCHCSISVYC